MTNFGQSAVETEDQRSGAGGPVNTLSAEPVVVSIETLSSVAAFDVPPWSRYAQPHLGPTSLLNHCTRYQSTARYGETYALQSVNVPIPNSRAASACGYEYVPTRNTYAVAWRPNEQNIDASEARSGELCGSSDGLPLTPNHPPLFYYVTNPT